MMPDDNIWWIGIVLIAITWLICDTFGPSSKCPDTSPAAEEKAKIFYGVTK